MHLCNSLILTPKIKSALQHSKHPSPSRSELLELSIRQIVVLFHAPISSDTETNMILSRKASGSCPCISYFTERRQERKLLESC